MFKNFAISWYSYKGLFSKLSSFVIYEVQWNLLGCRMILKLNDSKFDQKIWIKKWCSNSHVEPMKTEHA